MARGLLSRIYDELFAMGALHRGDTVLDCFGGVGTTGILGAPRGLSVVCVELEPKFVALARQNVERHRVQWEGMGCPIPIIVQGDSRQLRAVLTEQVDCLVSSPPYADQLFQPGATSRPEAKIARLLAEGKTREALIIRQNGSGPNNDLRRNNYG